MLLRKTPLALAILTPALIFANASVASALPITNTENQATVEAQVPVTTPVKKIKKTRVKVSQENLRIEDVLVTAQRRESTQQRVPAPISVLGGKVLLESGVGSTAAEVTKFIPNASAGQSGGHIRPRWWIRGVGTGTQGVDSPSPVGIYLDDVYLSNASATAFPLFDLERVEVLRGPQGTLWGKNTTGGAINIISQKPSHESDGYVKVSKSSFDTNLLQGAAGGSVIDNALAARFSFHQEKSDGAYYNLNLDENAQSFTDTAARVQLLWDSLDNVSALLNLHLRDYSVLGNNQTVVGTGVGGSYWSNGAQYTPSLEREHVSSTFTPVNNIEQDGVSLNVSWELDNGLSFTSISAFEGYDSQSWQDTDYIPLELTRSFSDNKTTQISQELRLASAQDSDWQWVAGAHYFKDRINSSAVAATLPIASKPIGRANAYNDTRYRHDTESVALFGNLTWRLSDDFSITGGLRWSQEQKDIDFAYDVATGTVDFADVDQWWKHSAVRTAIVTQVTQLDANKWSDWTWDITPEYLLSDNARVYAKLSKGFRGGGYNTAAKSQATLSVLDPEYLQSYELGYKSEWFNGSFIFNANVFTYDYDDIQINAVLPSPTGALSQLRNAAAGRTNGAELEVQALPFDNWKVRAGLGWLDTEFSDFSDVNGDYSGNQFVRSPEYSAVLAVEYQQPLASGAAITYAVDWNFSDEFYFFTNNQNNPNFKQKAYDTGSVRVSWTDAYDRLTLTAYSDNVTNTRYKLHTLPGTSGATGNSINWSQERSTGIAATFKF